MGKVDLDTVTDLITVTNLEGTKIVPSGPNASIFITSDSPRADAIRDALNDGLRCGRAYLRNEVPASLHYRNKPRIWDVVVVVNPGAMMGIETQPPVGTHGWNPQDPHMQGAFLASGPNILKGQRIGPFESIHIYPFRRQLLQLRPNPNINGDISVLAPLLGTDEPSR